MPYLLFLVWMANSPFCLGQSIVFKDLELKRYLIHELCVDSTGTGLLFSPDTNVDHNKEY